MSGDQLTILAVDDERTQLEDLARLLRNSPSVKEVECAYDGHDALVKASTQAYDAIFLDSTTSCLGAWRSPPWPRVWITASDSGVMPHM